MAYKSLTVNLGDSARDRITGLTGIVTAVTEWLNGCKRFALQPRELDKDGKPRDPVWFDEPQVEYLGTPDLGLGGKSDILEPAPGGPRKDPVR